jgi:hypothetical protein
MFINKKPKVSAFELLNDPLKALLNAQKSSRPDNKKQSKSTESSKKKNSNSKKSGDDWLDELEDFDSIFDDD